MYLNPTAELKISLEHAGVRFDPLTYQYYDYSGFHFEDEKVMSLFITFKAPSLKPLLLKLR